MNSIQNYEGMYSIDKSGNIWSEPRKAEWVSKQGKKYFRKIGGKFLKPGIDGWGYKYVYLCKNKEQSVKKVHRLVLETFVGPCPKGMVACHNNGNPIDNRLENLRWDTPKSNTQDAIKHGTHFQPYKLTELDVRWIRYLYSTGISSKELSKSYNVTYRHVRNIVTKKAWSEIA